VTALSYREGAAAQAAGYSSPSPPGEGRGEGPFPTVFGAACPWHRPPVPGNKRLPLFSFLANRTLTICATPLRKPDLPA
jgi:hypothetical protein